MQKLVNIQQIKTDFIFTKVNYPDNPDKTPNHVLIKIINNTKPSETINDIPCYFIDEDTVMKVLEIFKEVNNVTITFRNLKEFMIDNFEKNNTGQNFTLINSDFIAYTIGESKFKISTINYNEITKEFKRIFDEFPNELIRVRTPMSIMAIIIKYTTPIEIDGINHFFIPRANITEILYDFNLTYGRGIYYDSIINFMLQDNILYNYKSSNEHYSDFIRFQKI
jgi:hypothetical protein